MRHHILPTPLHALALVVGFGCAGCSGDPAANAVGDDPAHAGTVDLEAQLGDTVRLGVGDVLRIARTDFRLGFERVVRDYRCALDVRCVWAGDAEVLVRVVVAGTDDRRVLHLYGDPRSVRVAGFRVEVVELLPYPLNRPLADPAPPTIDVTVTAAP